MRGSREPPVKAASRSDCSPAQVTTRRAVMLDCVVRTLQLPGSLNAEPGFEGTRLVIDPRVNHTAVVPALVGGNLRFLFEHEDSNAGLPVDDLPCGRQADQAGADHCQVDVVREGQLPAARRRRASENMVSTRSTTQKRLPSATQRIKSMPPEPI